MMMSLKRSLTLIYLILIVTHLLAPLVMAQEAGNEVLVVDVTGPVTPIMLGLIERAIAEADTRNAEALIIRLDTPGGSVDLTQRIIQTMIAADVPLVVYVWPPGGHAASAGTFITLAGHVAVMAPSTSIGAASPIDGSGADIDETLRAKLENILVADIKGLADRRGEKALEWAQEAITEAKAASANEALELGVIDFVAKDLDDLLAQLDGFKVEVSGEEVTLQTAEAKVSFLQATTIEELLSIIANPSIALLLISIGGLAIFYEIIHPGGYMSGVIGVICLLIGLYAVGQLPVNYAGLALILLAFVLFGAELFAPTHGALTAGGVVAFIVGALILFNTNEFAYQLPWPSIVGIPVTLALIFGFGIRKALQARRAKPTTGQEGLVGAIGTVRVALEPEGSIFVWGERWRATSVDGQSIPAGARVKVAAIDGFQLKVEKVS
ncbi:MAG TPA: nodulation protein NfeD [Anaerolineae bacterium]|nr:nodulation protein NfeD [Anaerolineae bacterium]